VGRDVLEEQIPDLPRLGMPAEGFFGIQALPIDDKFVNPAGAGNQRPRGNMDFDLSLAQEFCRQTDGARRVASHGAVFKADVQALHDSPPCS